MFALIGVVVRVGAALVRVLPRVMRSVGSAGRTAASSGSRLTSATGDLAGALTKPGTAAGVETRWKVEGLDELMRDLKAADADLKEVREVLAKAAEPVAEEARRRAGQWGAKTASGIKAKSSASVSRPRIFVQQTARKVTGARPDFGARQMREALIPALYANEDRIVRDVEAAVDEIMRRHNLL